MDDNLELLLSKLDKKTRDRFKMASQVEKELLPTASLGLNYGLNGGIARGAITTVFGNTSSGKTAVMLQTIGVLQKRGLTCAFVDAEATYDAAWGARLGVDNDRLILIQKRSFGAIVDGVVPLLDAGLDFLVIDSISSALPEAFLDDDGKLREFDRHKQIGAHARSCSMMVNALHYANERTAIVLISQTTTDLSGMHPMQVPHGGKKVGFASTSMVKLTSSPQEKQQLTGEVPVGDKIHTLPIGRKVDGVITKNKVGPPNRTFSYNFYYAGDSVGVDNVDELVTMAKLYGAVTAGGAWVYFGEDKWNGQPKLVAELKENPALYNKIKEETELRMYGEIK